MKFKKFGKALLLSALSAVAVLGITSCIRSYSVGYLFVVGTTTAESTGNGIISGFKIDHNTGKLIPINGLPVSSGGVNPGRSILLPGGRFVYVLNRGKNAEGTADCTTTADPCVGANITQFAVGGNGILTPQETFYTQGINPFRMISDGSGNYIYVLDHDSPSSASCSLVLGTGVNSCGDITAFSVNQTTGRLTLVVNAQATSSGGQALAYFPVPANPIDFLLVSSYILTMSGTPTTGDSVFPYNWAQVGGQLTLNQNSSQPLNILNGTGLVTGSGGGANVVYVLDNDPITYIPTGQSAEVTAPSQILPFTVGTNGALQAETGGRIPDDPTLSNPIFALTVTVSKGSVLYVANQGNNADPNNAQSGIAGYIINTPFQLTEQAGSPFGSGAGPQCMIEDPSNQYIYTANFNDSTVTGHSIDQNDGYLNPLPGSANKSYPLNGPATWCMVTGRTG
jgi:6-phosphogluconolactonase (cycloisomerase 2 family)